VPSERAELEVGDRSDGRSSAFQVSPSQERAERFHSVKSVIRLPHRASAEDRHDKSAPIWPTIEQATEGCSETTGMVKQPPPRLSKGCLLAAFSLAWQLAAGITFPSCTHAFGPHLVIALFLTASMCFENGELAIFDHSGHCACGRTMVTSRTLCPARIHSVI
jgi:hypothetical protein